MKKNLRVALINRFDEDYPDPTWPPIGATGTTICDSDVWNEIDVMFDDYPCPVDLPDESWIVPVQFLVIIGDLKTKISEDEYDKEIESHLFTNSNDILVDTFPFPKKTLDNKD